RADPPPGTPLSQDPGSVDDLPRGVRHRRTRRPSRLGPGPFKTCLRIADGTPGFPRACAGRPWGGPRRRARALGGDAMRSARQGGAGLRSGRRAGGRGARRGAVLAALLLAFASGARAEDPAPAAPDPAAPAAAAPESGAMPPDAMPS